MKELHLKVGGAVEIVKDCYLSSGEVNTVQCVFDLPKEYDGLSVMAKFTYFNRAKDEYGNTTLAVDKTVSMQVADGVCEFPHEALEMQGTVKIGITAYELDGDTVNVRYSPTPLKKVVYEGSTTEEGENSSAATPTVFEQQVAEMQGYLNDAKQAKKAAESAAENMIAEQAPAMVEEAVEKYLNEHTDRDIASSAVTSENIKSALGYTPANAKTVDDLPNDETLIGNVAERVPFVKTAEQPTFVNSVYKCTDTSKVYVLPDGYLYGYRDEENYNLLKLSDVNYQYRLQDDAEGMVASNTSNAVTGWMPVEYGKYYALSALYPGDNELYIGSRVTSMYPSVNPENWAFIRRINFKKADGTIVVYGQELDSIKTVVTEGSAIAIPDADVIAIQIHIYYNGEDISNASKLAAFEFMFVAGNTAQEAYDNSVNREYVDGDAEMLAKWYNTGLMYNQPADYEDRVVSLENDMKEAQNNITEIKAKIGSPNAASPYFRDVNWGCVPIDYFRGRCDSYSTEDFANDTQYADYIAKFKELMTGHEAYVTESKLGSASDGQSIYLYDFKPVRWDDEQKNIPKIIIVAGQHGWEKCNVFGLYYLVKDLLNNWFGSPALEYLRHHVELMIVPVVNTYGFDNFQYKNANGVNINRNYSSNWTLLEDTTSEQYGGAEPFDQPESRMIRDLVLNNSDCVLLIDSHTNSTTNTESWEKLGYYGITNVDDDYFNRVRHALPELVSKISTNFNVDYSLNAPNTMFGFMSTSEGNGILRTWAADNNILSVLIEGFAGFLDGEPVSADVFKANEEQMVNWLITAVNYLSK